MHSACRDRAVRALAAHFQLLDEQIPPAAHFAPHGAIATIPLPSSVFRACIHVFLPALLANRRRGGNTNIYPVDKNVSPG